MWGTMMNNIVNVQSYLNSDPWKSVVVHMCKMPFIFHKGFCFYAL